jgi:transketolase
MRATRIAYGDALLELGKTNPKIVVLDADVAKSISSKKFHQVFPGRAFNMGIAEQNMMNTAAGLATLGFTVFTATYAVFASMRSCEQIRTFIAYPGLNVKIVGSHGGIHTGTDGATHQAIEDIGIMRSIPGITILSPADYNSALAAVYAAAEYPGPVYIRLTRNPVPDIYPVNPEFVIGKANLMLDEGRDFAIIATGVMAHEALQAAALLRNRGLRGRVIDMHTIRPFDKEVLIKAAQDCGAIVTAEDHNIQCGLGGAAAEVLSENFPVPLRRVGIPDRFGESGDPEALFNSYGMTANHLVKAVEEMVQRKCKIS